MGRRLVSFKEATEEEIKLCGGKGASLIKLTRAGLPVPEGYVLLSGAALSEVDALIPKLSDKCTYAVRSSALNEDGQKASFAGAYETKTDVPVSGIKAAVVEVMASAESERVEKYAQATDTKKEGIAVVIQRFVRPEYAGVLFTSDVISGSAEKMIGNYVKGEGELLVSGSANAYEFSYNAIKYDYEGPEEFGKYAKKLYKYSKKIRELYGMPMDIEWAVSNGKVYILQARPITTLHRGDEETFSINGSFAGDYFLTRTNVGEIFMQPTSPITYSILETMFQTMGVPHFVDNIEGQAYLNVSTVMSIMVALGMKKESAYKKLEDLTGILPDGVEVPIFPVKKGPFVRKILHLICPKRQKTKRGLSCAREIEEEIKHLETPQQLRAYWDEELLPFINKSLTEIMKGINVLPLFGTKEKIEKCCGQDLAARLMTGSVGVLDSMKPMLFLEDLIAGKITKEEYINICGHRHANEMELICPYPYEDPSYVERAVEDHVKSGLNVHAMKEAQEKNAEQAWVEFCENYPKKKKWMRKKLDSYAKANQGREYVRSEGVRIFCALRQYVLSTGRVTGIGEDVFMLYMDELLALLEGKNEIRSKIPKRRENYEKNMQQPPFPNNIFGRFDPKKWIADPNRRNDFFFAKALPSASSGASAKVTGFPGAAGCVTGRAHVIIDIRDAESLQEGEILVTNATNIGWTMIFPRAAAVVTDIGAPLSHAAIVAREFGIPAVVGCGNATTEIHTGDLITVDGAAGEVRKENLLSQNHTAGL